ncbi:MAG: hypothetical protein KY468_16860, partial [Armatimonadetes bacterium]|nr:hypothetical protein [Armatimonadota bacterium]
MNSKNYPSIRRLPMVALFLAALVTHGGVHALVGVPGGAGPRLHLQAGTLSPAPLGTNRETALAFLRPGVQTALLQFAGPVRDEWKEAARHSGLQLLRYVPDFGYVARGDKNAFRAAVALPYVRWIGPYLPAYRVSPALPDSGPAAALLSL